MILTKTVLYRGREISYDELKNNSVIPLTVKCDRCGKEFETTKYRLIRNGHELCQGCALKKKLGKQLPNGYVSGRLTVISESKRSGYSICECVCGNIIEVRNYELKNNHAKSCGCLRSENAKANVEKYLSQYQHGESHPNWRGGIAPKRNCIESTKEYKQWKQAVLSKGRCEKCGATDNLVPHHICNFRDYPDIRLDQKNGACLCQTCHRQFHHIYGLTNTTEEQYKDFLSGK